MCEAERQPPPPTLRRRISNPVLVPTKLALPTTKPLLSTSSLPTHFTAYTSLKDIIPSSVPVNSPTAAAPTANSGYQIPIRNRLVKQAAWAYLQPMSSSPDSSGPHFIRRLWLRLSTHNPLSSFLRFIHIRLLPGLRQVLDRIRLVLGIHAPR